MRKLVNDLHRPIRAGDTERVTSSEIDLSDPHVSLLSYLIMLKTLKPGRGKAIAYIYLSVHLSVSVCLSICLCLSVCPSVCVRLVILPTGDFADRWFCRTVILQTGDFADRWFCRCFRIEIMRNHAVNVACQLFGTSGTHPPAPAAVYHIHWLSWSGEPII